MVGRHAFIDGHTMERKDIKLYKKGISCKILLDVLYDKKYYSGKPKNNGLKWL